MTAPFGRACYNSAPVLLRGLLIMTTLGNGTVGQRPRRLDLRLDLFEGRVGRDGIGHLGESSGVIGDLVDK